MRGANTTAWICLALGLGLMNGAAGCGAPAKAEPLEVTYYYLPG